MKLVIASDIHGSAHAARILCDFIGDFKPDRVVLLGDLLYHGPRNDLPDGYAPKEVFALLNDIETPITAVRGNCDAEVDQMVLEFPIMSDFALFDIDGRRACATHGHVFALDNPPAACAGTEILMSGHTHVKVLERRGDGLILLNPGSTSIPKDGIPSYATYNNGTFALRGLDGAYLKTLAL